MKKSPINRFPSNTHQKAPILKPKIATNKGQRLPMVNLRKSYSKKNTDPLQTLENIIFKLTEANIQSSSQSAFVFFDNNFPYSFNYLISILIYSAFISQKYKIIIYLNFLKHIEVKEKNIHSYPIFYVFKSYLVKLKSQESCYLLSKMIEHELIQPDFIEEKKSLYFANYYTKEEIQKCKYKFYEQFFLIFEELSKNDWELHKKYVKEGHNPNEIAQIIRKDEIEKLQEISSQTNFDYNQIIEPSLYERYSFINEENVTLIDYAAFFGSVKCFKYLLMNGAKVENAGKYAIAGGNEEIIHLCEQNHSTFDDSCETAIIFHKMIYLNIFMKTKTT